MGCGQSLQQVKSERPPTSSPSDHNDRNIAAMPLTPTLPLPLLHQHLNSPSIPSPTQPSFTLPQSLPQFSFDNYQIIRHLSSGGLGVVYLTQHTTSREYMAMKFFGYAPKEVNYRDIIHELSILSDIRHLKGIVQVYGVTYDTLEGYVPNKIWKYPYPVIGMEYLSGGDLMDKIQSRTIINEKYLANIFYKIVLNVSELHQCGYIHCDLKLENIMFTTSENKEQEGDFESSLLKIIDLGMVLKLPAKGVIYIEDEIRGTPGYYAPESYMKGCYSIKSDIWQLGCILYSLLSGFQPFSSNGTPGSVQQLILGRYKPMIGSAWSSISDEAKQLMKSIFQVNPDDRLSCEEILQHEWVQGHRAPIQQFQEQYFEQFSQLALGQRLKKIFHDQNIFQNTKEIQEKLKKIIPIMRSKEQDEGKIKIEVSRPSTCSLHAPVIPSEIGQHDGKYDQQVQNKFIQLQHAVLYHSASRGDVKENYDQHGADVDPIAQVIEGNRRCGNVNIQEFITILQQCELSELANSEVFSIFDRKGTGEISMKDFLVAMVIFRHATPWNPNSRVDSSHSPSSIPVIPVDATPPDPSSDDDTSIIHFYFNLFDLNHTGEIGLDELKLVLRCFCSSSSAGGGELSVDLMMEPPTEEEIEELFQSMKRRKNDKINYEEFQIFYQNLMNSNSRKLSK